MQVRRGGWAACALLLTVVVTSCTSTAAGPTTLTAAPSTRNSVSGPSATVGAPSPLASGPAAIASAASSVSSSPRVLASTDVAQPSPTTAVSASTPPPPAPRPTPTTLPTPTVKTTQSSTAVPPVQTAGLSKAEIADRTAIELMWTKYWDTIEQIARVPEADRKDRLAKVSVDPAMGNVLAQTAIFDKNGWDNYGTVYHRPYWGPPVDGEKNAIMGDCLDNSHAGRLDVKTQQKLTVGIPRSNVRGSFERLPDGEWRVTAVVFLDQPC